MRELLPGGLWPVMLTAFHEDGRLDWNGIDALVDWYLATGAAGLFACCGSSEMYHLTPDERLTLTAHVVKRVAGRIPVIATGTFGGPLAEQITFVRHVADLGVDAVVLMPNQLVAAGDDEAQLQAQIEALLAKMASVALGLYECPSPYHRLLSPPLTAWLAQTERFCYLKDTTSNPAAIRAKLSHLTDTTLQLYNANTQSALCSLQAGAAGLSPIAANGYPEFFSWLCTHFATEPTKAQELQQMLTLLETNLSLQYPASAKLILQQRGLPISTTCRSRKLERNHNLTAMVESLLATVDQLALRLEIELFTL